MPALSASLGVPTDHPYGSHFGAYQDVQALEHLCLEALVKLDMTLGININDDCAEHPLRNSQQRAF
jgi:hypothetical protein